MGIYHAGLTVILVACGFSSADADSDSDSDTPSAPDPGAGSAEDFLEAFGEAFCDQAIALDCGECVEATGTTTTDPYVPDCDFDPVAAEACLDGEWTCTSITVPGADDVEFVTPPDVCSQVFDCGTISTGTYSGGS